MSHLIIQAGGRGSRLRHHTWNKPKALTTVNGNSLIHLLIERLCALHDFDHVSVIDDYKGDVLRQYMTVFPAVRSIQFFKAEADGGTCSGIKRAAQSHENMPTVVTWCDLLFLREASLADLDWSSDAIGLSQSFNCRWSLSNGRLLHTPSNESGIAGFFFFKNTELLSALPDKGEFVRILSGLENYNPKPFFLNGVDELGDFDHYQSRYLSTESVTRFFNRITIDGDTVTKECVVPEFNNLITNEINWYREVSQRGYSYIPELITTSPLRLSRIDGVSPHRMCPTSNVVLSSLRAIRALHDLGSTASSDEDIKTMYFDKTVSRIEKVKQLLPINAERLVINGKSVANIFNDKYSPLLQYAEAYIKSTNPSTFALIHGDPTFSNTIYRKSNQTTYLIDPRGSFGTAGIYGDHYYDYAKLLYSCKGNYDNFNSKRFTLSQNELDPHVYTVSVDSSGYEVYANVIYSSVEHPERLDLLHSLIWLSLAGYVDDHYDSIVGAFLLGLLYFDEFLSKSNLIPSTELGKTYFLDIDGTLVTHNGHLNGNEISLIPESLEFLQQVSSNDLVCLTTARHADEVAQVLDLVINALPSGTEVKVLADLPKGERILVNDRKPSGLCMAYALSPDRNKGITSRILPMSTL